MTKKAATKETQPTPQVFVYGEDEAGKPRGARFPATERDRLLPVVETMKLGVFDARSEELNALGMKLPVGRIYARGKSFIPSIRRELYDKIHAGVVKLQETEGGTGSLSADTTNAPLASGLPQDWQSIAAGHLILVQESPAEGWWEAIVIGRDNDILTLRYRDFPKVPKFDRHVSTIAMINPGPA
jgi:hypothetical protein